MRQVIDFGTDLQFRKGGLGELLFTFLRNPEVCGSIRGKIG